MKQYQSLFQAIKGLRKEGYTLEFNIIEERIACYEKNTLLSPDDFEIDIIYRFETVSEPNDRCILYAISSMKHDLKGILVNGLGLPVDGETDDVVSRLHMHTA